MKSLANFLIVLVAMLSQMSCLQDSCTDERVFTQYTPVNMTRAEFEKANLITSIRPLNDPGKMYFYQNYLFINEKGLGVHVYDLTDISNPQKISFYDIPGNFDIAIKDHYLYADNVIDLITIDISDINAPVVVAREKDYLKQYVNFVPQTYYVYSVKTNVTQILTCENPNFNNTWFWGGVDDVFLQDATSGIINVKNTSTFSNTGISGSFARFTVVDNDLYVVGNSNLMGFDIQTPEKPRLKSDNNLGWGIETIFPYKDKLFIGSSSGMFIFERRADGSVNLASTFTHARACDPIVVEGNTAYVTLRNGNRCSGFENQLDVIDVTNIYSPSLIMSYGMKNPHGLAVRDASLYIAEGDFGFKVLDASDPKNVTLITSKNDKHAYDMISLDKNTLFIIGEDGFYIYDVTDNSDPKVLSSIKPEP